jgi:hypothetical protein
MLLFAGKYPAATIRLVAGGVLLSLTLTVRTQITSSLLSYGERIAISFRRLPRVPTVAGKSVLREPSQVTRDSRKLSLEIHRRLVPNDPLALPWLFRYLPRRKGSAELTASFPFKARPMSGDAFHRE